MASAEYRAAAGKLPVRPEVKLQDDLQLVYNQYFEGAITVAEYIGRLTDTVEQHFRMTAPKAITEISDIVDAYEDRLTTPVARVEAMRKIRTIVQLWDNDFREVDIDKE